MDIIVTDYSFVIILQRKDRYSVLFLIKFID